MSEMLDIRQGFVIWLEIMEAILYVMAATKCNGLKTSSFLCCVSEEVRDGCSVFSFHQLLTL